MKLEHSFDVPARVERVWPLLLDLERVAPCLPGGEVTSRVDERTYEVRVRVKLGPVQMTYGGRLTLDEVDEASRTVVMSATTREQRGQGTAEATITTRLSERDGATHAEATADLQLTGRAAQMGRSIVEDVSHRLLGQFADCLGTRLGASHEAEEPAEADEGAREAAPAPTPDIRPISGLSLALGVLRDRLRRLLGARRR
jgi:carbon monoxide dehydrogenase subunit G